MLGQDSNFAPIPFTCPIKKLLWNSAHQDIKTWKLKQGEEKKNQPSLIWCFTYSHGVF